MDEKKLFWAMLAATCLLAAGCGANMHAMYRHEQLDPENGAVITVDAKQRHLLISPQISIEYDSESGGVEYTKTSIQRFCAEPSPDVFSVVAQSLSASGTFGKRPDPKAIEAALTAAFSSAEQGSTIPRTQTINMLRELMYRTCERYLNGGINDLELSIQAARDQRLMVSILAIESLTGAVTPKPVVIGAASSSEAGNKTGSGAEAAVRLDDAYKDLKAKRATMTEREVQYNAVNGVDKTPGVCDGIRAAIEKKEDLSEEQKKKKDECAAKWDALVDAKSAVVTASAHYEKLSAVSTLGTPPASSATELMTPKADGGIDRAHGESIKEVAKAVETIVLHNLSQDEFAFFCIKYMSPNAGKEFSAGIADDDDTKNKCLEYFRSQLDVEIAKNEVLSKSLIDQSINSLRDEKSAQFELFWKNASKDGKTVSKEAFENLGLQDYQCFRLNESKEHYRKCFMSNDELTRSDRERLSRPEVDQ